MILSKEQWTINHLHEHLQAAVDLEFWTIPFYMSAMYSIKDRNAEAYQLIRTVVNQEMLHLQSAANIANAYGLSPTFNAPEYKGKHIPHLNFDLDNPEVIKQYEPFTAEIGPLDKEHINAMCLIEIPEDISIGKQVLLHSKVEEYGSIGAFYKALREGAAQMTQYLKGNVRQVDFFSAYYRNMPSLMITESGQSGYDQVDLLIDLITEQGEGAGDTDPIVPSVFQNTADDQDPNEDHYMKFMTIREAGKLPEVFTAKPPSRYNKHEKKLEAIVIDEFTKLREALTALFSGQRPDSFFPLMAGAGGAIRNCWANGVSPKFG